MMTKTMILVIHVLRQILAILAILATLAILAILAAITASVREEDLSQDDKFCVENRLEDQGAVALTENNR